MREPYRGAEVRLLTQHGKEQVIAPLFREVLQATVTLVTGFDTDSLGTFTRDVPRAGTQLEAARAKARLAAELSGSTLGLGSEGAFAPGPLGFGTWNLELVVFLDTARGLELVGRHHTPGRHVHGLVGDQRALTELARRAGFPEFGLVLRADGENGTGVQKGIRAWDVLEDTFEHLRRQSTSGQVFVENDLRAHMHPERMASIGAATRDLLQRLRTPCPACGAPGFGVSRSVPGLECRDCGAPTREPRAHEWACPSCDHRELRALKAQHLADPARCDHCNP